MSVLESFEAADASLLEQIKTQQTTEGAEDKQPKDVEEVIDESTEEIIEESTETEGNDTDDSDESDVVDDKASDDTEEDDPKDNAKKGWKVRQELKAEKEKREAIEKRLDEMQSTLTNAGITKEQLVAAQQQQLLQQQAQQQQQEKKAEPDKELDLDAWNTWKFKQQDQQIAQYQQAIVNQQQQMQVNQARQELVVLENNYQNKEYPQYSDAKEFLKTSYKNELKLQYPQATDAQLDLEISNQELILASNAVNGGMNPAESIKRMAEARGFVGSKQSSTTNKKANISKMAQNQKRSANLIGRSGETKKDKLSANDILEMTLNNRLKLSDKDWSDSEVPYVWGKR